ncbi:MAG: YbhB/YbcL family Raf kinase inhibitor-like protein [Candidatus Margulisbacteria bacterium]|nr:YbhB/YbcL family Raf kinase inhibitor-like protein [Candidatus Margulisiibacteriota bacterium]
MTRKIALFLILVLFAAGLASALKKGGSKMLTLKSPAFKNQANLPAKYSCQGEGVSPPLVFENVPPKTKSFVLTVEDPDAPSGTFDHWLLFNIPAEVREIKEGGIPAGSLAGKNTIGKLDYVSPCPPPGKTHRYIFTLYALDMLLPLDKGVNKQELKKAMTGHVISQASLTGLFKR